MKNEQLIQQQFQARMNEDELLNCMRCGFCLPTCPTYIESGFQESHSPRGRIALMKAVVDGLIEPDEDVERSLQLCLGCRACEPVCPSGVRYGHLLEEARDIIAQHKRYPWFVRLVRHVVFKQLFPHPKRMRMLTALIGFYQRSGLQALVRKLGLLRVLPNHLAMMENVLPNVPTWKQMNERPTHIEAETKRKKRVAFFSGCLMDTMFMDTNDATMKLLQLVGCDIVIPPTKRVAVHFTGIAAKKRTRKRSRNKTLKRLKRSMSTISSQTLAGAGRF